jgi:hypothetical protein
LSRSTIIIARSLLFNIVFYLNLIVHMIVAFPTLVLPYPILREFIRSYAVTSLWLLRVISGIKVEWRGLDNIPKGSCIIACKHQSLWETFALYAVLRDPIYILKRELDADSAVRLVHLEGTADPGRSQRRPVGPDENDGACTTRARTRLPACNLSRRDAPPTRRRADLQARHCISL